MLRVTEIFHSIQGESTRAGLPCVFIRLTGCHLRCRYCDTEYAFREGRPRTVEEVVDVTCAFDCELVEVTGGEPLLQKDAPRLIAALCDRGRTVLVETSGACDIDLCDPRAIRIVDFKTPGSGEEGRNDWENLERLTGRDEVKLVITDRADYEWSRDLVRRHRLADRCAAVLLSPVHEQPAGVEIPGAEGLDPRLLSEWILEDALPVRLQLQIHKFIWSPQARGV